MKQENLDLFDNFLTQEMIKYRFSYNQYTGVFTRRSTHSVVGTLTKRLACFFSR